MKNRAIFFDIETTGIKIGQDRIVEIAGYDPEQDKTFTSLVNPLIPIPLEAQTIHHISDEMVKDVPSFDVIAKQFIDFCDQDAILIAHNGDNFDRPFIEYEFKRVGVDIPKWDYLDTLKWARKYRSDLPRHALQILRELFGIPENKAHRALDDVMILYQVFKKMTDDLPIEQIVSLMKDSGDSMPFGKYQGRKLQEIPKSYLKWLHEQKAFEKPENRILKENLEKAGLYPC